MPNGVEGMQTTKEKQNSEEKGKSWTDRGGETRGSLV